MGRALVLRALRLHVIDPDAPTAPADRRARTAILTGNVLTGVEITNPQDGDVLTFDATDGVWKNTPAA